MCAKQNKQAAIAIHAATLRQTIGSYAARRYAVKNGVLRLYTLACQLSAIEKYFSLHQFSEINLTEK